MSGAPPGLTRTIAIWGGIEEKVRSGYYDNMLKGGKIADDPIDSGDDSSADATAPPAITDEQRNSVRKFLRKKERTKKPEA